GVIAFRSRTDPPKPEFARQVEQPQIKEQPIVEEPKVDHPQPIAHKPRKPAKRRVPKSEVANHMNREIATDFMPLGYLNPATLQDGGQIIRVEVPRSTLVKFGLTVTIDRYNEKV